MKSPFTSKYHPDSQALLMYAEGLVDSHASMDNEVFAHIQSCDACKAKVSDIRKSLVVVIVLGTFWGPGDTAILTGSAFWLRWFALSLIVWGGYVFYLMIRNPDELSRVENHPSWKHMYLMMMWAQVGFALAYLLPEPF